jgi:DNA repair photolyase
MVRVLDICHPMAGKGPAYMAISVTTLDSTIARKLEPRTPTPAKRIEAILALAKARIPTAVLAAPMIPALNDSEMEAILEATQSVGASAAEYIMLHLPLEIRDLFVEWLHGNFPDRTNHVISLVRDTRNGADYNANWGTRMTGTGAYAALMRQRFAIAAARLGLNKRRHDLDITQFSVPPREDDQLTLF